MSECNCTLAEKLVGDGCEVCNPAKALEYAKDTITDLREELSAVHRELAAIHAVTLCIACVKEVDKSAPYTVQAVQQMAMRINEMEKK